ncbi:hypothetical protein LO762_20030 [Actinocorallia sp. API 0066]|uniref:hypothetical protein n=1 Tax=Actinocorallia sp. API 0066 TaxID=2896846 RepID=UPI001E5D7909|nr:hypothetical protein [Actinocorallia sp. API 0066]MCD0451468.1 hypothetical protein [Actinocorallia sp. API 0066]
MGRREVVLRVLGWGTVVYFLIIGFALDRHALFELRAPAGVADLQRAQRGYALALEARAREVREDEPLVAAEMGAQAARIRVEVEEAVKEQADGRYRAVGLIAGTGAFALGYPWLIYVVYRRTDPDGTLAAGDLIPLRAALGYGVVTSVITFVAGFSTAYQ